MAENIPLKVIREQNLSVSLWENIHKGNIYKSIIIQQTFVTKDTKNKPQEERKYNQKNIKINYDQIEILQRMLENMKTEEKENE